MVDYESQDVRKNMVAVACTSVIPALRRSQILLRFKYTTEYELAAWAHVFPPFLVAYAAALRRQEEEALGKAQGEEETDKGACERRRSGATIGTANIDCTSTCKKYEKETAPQCYDTEGDHGGRAA